MALKRQRQRRQVGIIELHPERESRVELDPGLLKVPCLGKQPPEVLMQLPGQRTESITNRAGSIGQQAGGQPAMGLDAGQHISGPDLILNAASRGKDIGECVDRCGVNPSWMTDGKRYSFPIIRVRRNLPRAWPARIGQGKQRAGGDGGGRHVEAELSRCRVEHGAQCPDIELAGTPDTAAFQLAEVVGVECDTTALVVVFGSPQHDGFGQFLTGHIRAGNTTRRGAFTGRAKQPVWRWSRADLLHRS
jgi:hypothetical protein